jgi:thiamine-monophosphate kinase
MIEKGLTEREIIRVLKRRFDLDPKLPLGFEDDVAAFPMSQRTQVVLKTDMLVGSTDVPPGMTLRQAARKAVVATVSDFAAKGVQPRGLLMSLGLTPPVRLSTVNEIASGIENGAREYHCRIIGGDTSETDDLVIDCIGFGFARTGRILRRDGAKPGDVVAVTGDFGKTAAGLRILLGKKKPWPHRFSKLTSSVLRASN